jgi:hypothetical protein
MQFPNHFILLKWLFLYYFKTFSYYYTFLINFLLHKLKIKDLNYQYNIFVLNLQKLLH